MLTSSRSKYIFLRKYINIYKYHSIKSLNPLKEAGITMEDVLKNIDEKQAHPMSDEVPKYRRDKMISNGWNII